VTPAFGGVYNAADANLTLGATQTPLNIAGTASASSGVTVNPSNSTLTINQAGTYQISYGTSYSVPISGAYVQTYVTANGSPIAGTAAGTNPAATQVTPASQSNTVYLPAGTVLQLAAQSTPGTSLYLPANGTSLQVNRVGE
jgi:hypothetical protein